MTLRIAVAGRNAGLDATFDRADAGSGPGTITYFTGSQPANADAAETGTALVTFTLADPAFSAATGGVKDLDADPDISAVAVAAGNAGWARCKDSAGTKVFDGSVTATGGGGDFILNSIAIVIGQTVNLTLGSITDPVI